MANTASNAQTVLDGTLLISNALGQVMQTVRAAARDPDGAKLDPAPSGCVILRLNHQMRRVEAGWVNIDNIPDPAIANMALPCRAGNPQRITVAVFFPDNTILGVLISPLTAHWPSAPDRLGAKLGYVIINDVLIPGGASARKQHKPKVEAPQIDNWLDHL